MTDVYKQQPCERFAVLISAMIDGELETQTEDQLNEHLQQCESCRKRVDSFQQIDSLILQSSDRCWESADDFDAALLPPNKLTQLRLAKPHRIRKTMMRWVPLATAATILVGLMITTLPSNRSTVTAEQIARPLAELEIINAERREIQRRMRKMLELDLRALKLEIAQLDDSDPDDAALKKRLEEHLNRLIERVVNLANKNEINKTINTNLQGNNHD